MNKKAILYARVSTDDQADKGYSLPSQIEAMRRYAEHQGFEVVAELREDISGALPISDRPEGKKLLSMLKTNHANAIIAHQVDRLYRDNVELLIAVRMWLRAGVEVHTCDIGKIEDENNIILLIKGWQGSDERKKIRERCMRGKRAKMQAGKVVCTRAPFGYVLGRDSNSRIATLVIDPVTGRIIRLIYHWYINGVESGKPLSQEKIMDRLNAMRAPTPGKRKKTKPGEWNRQAVNFILSNEVYAGVYRYGVLIGASSKKRPIEETVSVNVPPIIEREIWERAQARKQYNKAMALRNAKYDYLLRGLLHCGCGTHMSGLSKYGKRSYYVCDDARSVVAKRKCHETKTRAEILEWQIWEGLRQRTKDIDKLKIDLEAARQSELNDQEPKRAELEALEANIAQTERKATGLVRAMALLADTDPDGVVTKSMQVEIDQTNDLHRDQLKRRAELQTELGARHLTDDAIGDVIQFAEDVRDGIEHAEHSDYRRTIETLGVTAIIKGGRYYAKCLLGKWDEDILSLLAFRALARTVDGGSLLEFFPCHL